MEQIHTKQKLVEAVKNIPVVAEREGWVLAFDTEEGTLYYAPSVMPSGALLHQVTDEYALYLDDKGNPVGVAIEYFRSNFLKHHDTFNEITDDVFNNEDVSDAVITIDADEIKENKYATIFRALLESTLIKEADVNCIPV